MFRKKIVRVQWTPVSAFVTLECGHTAVMNQIYTYKLGSLERCCQCGYADDSKALESYDKLLQERLQAATASGYTVEV
jgi:hypothetical protein